MVKCIKNILKDERPECEVEGHRVHTTMNTKDEPWPKWAKYIIGIAGGFAHFEYKEDSEAWHAFQNGLDINKKEVKEEKGPDPRPGRCDNECGPIGFYDVA